MIREDSTPMQARHALLFTGLLWLSSCASTNPALLGEGGVRLDRLPERPYRVALLPIADVGALRSAETSGLRFELGEAQLPDEVLRRALEEQLRIFSRVDCVATDADLSGFDLVVAPRIASGPKMAFDGSSGGATTGTIAWLLTWYLGTMVPDATYRSELDMELQLRSPGEDLELATELFRSQVSELSYWQRQSTVGGFFQSLIIPPAFSADDDEVTSISLSHQMLLNIAGSFANWVKMGASFEAIERRQLTTLQLDAEPKMTSTPEGRRVRSRRQRRRGGEHPLDSSLGAG
jgi:hypothetical protein